MEIVKICPTSYISRDKIRFSMLKDDEDYFAHEDEVFDEFIHQIQEALNTPESGYVIADATHLNERSRNKTLDRLDLPVGTDIIPVNVYPGIQKCLNNNEKRKGRAKVPRGVIRRMCMQYEPPADDEKYKYYTVFTSVMHEKEKKS